MNGPKNCMGGPYGTIYFQENIIETESVILMTFIAIKYTVCLLLRSSSKYLTSVNYKC